MSFLQYNDQRTVFDTNGFGSSTPRTFDIVRFLRNGDNTPGYHLLKRQKRKLPVNRLTTAKFKGLIGEKRATSVYGSPTGPYSVTAVTHVMQAEFQAPQDLIDRALNSARSQLLGRLSSQDINLAQAFGERSQLTDMLATTATRFIDGFRALKRGDWRKCLRVLQVRESYAVKRSGRKIITYEKTWEQNPFRAASSLWLEFQYGWRPFMSDIDGAAKTLAEKHVKDESGSFYKTEIYSGSCTLKDNYDLIQIPTETSSGYMRRRSEVTAKTIIRANVENEFLRYSQKLGITNPALLAWELTPFSFVVDWFLPIGNYLKNSQAAWGMSFQFGSESVKQTNLTNGRYELKSPDNTYYEVTTYRLGVNTIYNRNRITSFPDNPLPDFKNPYSLTHAANAIALLVQVFSGGSIRR